MQHPPNDSHRRPPRVAIICGLANAFGRDVTLGATCYANLKRSWDLRIETWNDQPINHLPPCEGAIVAGSGTRLLSWLTADAGTWFTAPARAMSTGARMSRRTM